jgi:hypothetical protein
MEPSERKAALEQLDVFVGEWTLAVDLPGAPPDLAVRSTFEWALGRQFLVQRTSIPIPEVPDSLCVYRVDLESGAYEQHYFDSRGVVRIYEMTLEDGVWRLERHKPDFSPLPFHQRYVGVFSPDGGMIEGAWERSPDGEKWERDFGLTYARSAAAPE